MNRNEFLSRLKEALEGNMSSRAVQENVQYYKTYIEEEVKNGRSEQEVVEELGDPWAIAKTLIETPGSGADYQEAKQPHVREREESRGEPRIHVFGLDTWWKKLLLFLAVAGILFLIISVVMGVITLAARVFVPVLLILVLVRMFSGRRR